MKNEWWYPDGFWIEAVRIIVFSSIIQIGLILLIGIPNLIFRWGWINYISWLLVLNYVICNMFVLSILIKGLWGKIKEA